MFYYHTKVNEGSHRITIGGIITQTDKQHNRFGEYTLNDITLTACRTSLSDNFCKATGRKLVRDRFEKEEFCTTLRVEIDAETKPGKVFVEIAKKFAEHLEVELSEKRVASFKYASLVI